MIVGHVRDGMPRVTLSLRARNGTPVAIEFIVDTAFQGELALPSEVVRELDAVFAYDRPVVLADGTRRKRPYHTTTLEWYSEARVTEIAIMESQPLLGVELLAEHLLTVEITDGGEVVCEPL